MKRRVAILLCLLALMLPVFGNQWIQISTPEWINEIEEIDGKFYIASNGGLVIYDPQTGSKEHYFISDGLPSTNIEDIVKGPDGNIWIGTYDNGIAYLDNGEWVKVFNPLSASSNTLLTYCLVFDDDGVLWTGTSNGIQKYENGLWSSQNWTPTWDMVKRADGSILAASTLPIQIQNGSLEQDTSCPIFAYSGATAAVDQNENFVFSAPGAGIAIKKSTGWEVFDDSNSVIQSTGSIGDIELSSTGVLWAIIPSTAVYSYNGAFWKQEFTNLDLNSLGITTKQLLPMPDGTVYIGTSNSLTYYDGNSFQEIDLSYRGLVSNRSELAVDENGDIILKNGGLLYEAVSPLSDFNELPLPGNHDNINAMRMVEMPNGKVGLLDRYTGELWVDGIATSIYSPQDLPFISPSYIRSVLVDEENRYWIGGIGGLFVIDDQGNQFIDDSNSPFTDPNFWELAEDLQGNVWASTPDGIGMWDGSAWTYHNAADHNYIFAAAGLDFYFDDNNELWFGGWGTGLVHFDGSIWENYTTANSDISHNTIYDFENRDGDLFIASGEGISVFDGSGFTNMNLDNSDISSNLVNQIKFDHEGNMWLSHPGIGISVYNKDGFTTGISIPAPENSNLVNVYPNPASETLYIRLDESLKGMPVQLLDIQGRVLTETSGLNSQLSLEGYTEGFYLIRVGSRIVQKIVVR